MMNLIRLLHKKHQFRLALCGHKAVETGFACFMFMVQGQVGEATLGHFLIARFTDGSIDRLPSSGNHFDPPRPAFFKQMGIRRVCGGVRVFGGCLGSRLA